MSSEVATTGSDVARPAGRLARRGYPPLDPQKTLTSREQLMLAYMVFGCDKSFVSQLTRLDADRVAVPIQPGQPLTIEEAADLLRIRRRRARAILASPQGDRLIRQLTTDLRNGHRVTAMQRLVAQLHRPQVKAADARIVQDAALAILDTDIRPQQPGRPGVTVNVAVTPGYVIGRDSRTERASITIDAHANPPADQQPGTQTDRDDEK